MGFVIKVIFDPPSSKEIPKAIEASNLRLKFSFIYENISQKSWTHYRMVLFSNELLKCNKGYQIDGYYNYVTQDFMFTI